MTFLLPWPLAILSLLAHLLRVCLVLYEPFRGNLQTQMDSLGISPENKDLNWVEWRGVSYAG
jgi:hypothetical protein